MDREGSAVIGFFLVVGLVMAFGWPAAIILVGPLVIDCFLGWIVLPLLRGRLTPPDRAQRFRYLPALEQALRRASQGFALCVFAVLTPVAAHVWFYGWRDFAGMLSRPDEFWVLVACAALFVVGAVRFLAGAPSAAGARDTMGWFMAAIRLGLGATVLVWLLRTDLFGPFAEWPGGIYGCAAVFAPALWLALVGFMRLLLLSWPRRQAKVLTGIHIREAEFSWKPPRWWQFWKRWKR